jgi:hyperosmotically inducible periplasmic protein
MVNRFRGLMGVAALVVLASFVAGCVKTTTSAGRQVDDAAIKTSVKTKLAADVKLSTLTNIEVNSTNGVVTLAGQVDTADQKRMAADVARSVDGVVKVNNNLQVKGM